jgi:hypothetical protein
MRMWCVEFGTFTSPVGGFSVCDPVDASPFVGRGGEVREPGLGDAHADLPTSAKGRSWKNFKATIPVTCTS